MIAFDVPHQVQVPLERDVRVVSALNQDLNAAQRFCFVDLRADLLERKRVAFSVLGSAIECAESAIGDADIRVIDVSVDDVRDDVARVQTLANTICLGAELDQRRIRVEVEEIAHQAAGRKVNVPFGTVPRCTRRR